MAPDPESPAIRWTEVVTSKGPNAPAYFGSPTLHNPTPQGPDMSTPTDAVALRAAINAAASAAVDRGDTPATCAMNVICAYLIARAQLDLANKEADKSLTGIDQAGEVAQALLTATGFSAPTGDALRAMALLGLQPLVRIESSSGRGLPEPSGEPHRRGWRTAASEWLLRTRR